MNRYNKPPRSSYKSYWLNAANYYVLTCAAAIAIFFLVAGLLREDNEEPYAPAGIAASVVLVSAVVVRRAILKNHQMRFHAARQLENNLASLRANSPALERKLTIEKNASILRELKRKSDAAMVLAQFAQGHREVVDLCSQYLEINDREMLTVNPGSPRIAALRRGREIAEDHHRRHMLKWAEIETTSLLENAQRSTKSADKVEFASKALAVIDSATVKYPRERKLVESATAISEFIVKIKVANLVERAGRAETRGNIKLAERHFRTALFELNKSAVSALDRDAAVEKITSELERLGNSELK